MRSLRLAAPARRDLLEAVAYVAADNPDAARRLRERLVAAAELLLEFPAIGVPHVRDQRTFVVAGTRFRLIYRVRGNIVTVLRIYYGARQWPPAS